MLLLCLVRVDLTFSQYGALAFEWGQNVIFESLVTFTDNVMGVSERRAKASLATLFFFAIARCLCMHPSGRHPGVIISPWERRSLDSHGMRRCHPTPHIRAQKLCGAPLKAT